MLQRFLKTQHSRNFASVYTFGLQLGVVTAAIATGFAVPANAASFTFIPGDLIVSGSNYVGTASTVAVGQLLPSSIAAKPLKAIADGTFPNVFLNNTVDSSFGVTSPIFLQQFATSGTNSITFAGAVNVDPSLITTSFPSKSELAINLTADKTALTFMGYQAPVNALDVSNTNTPGIIEPGNLVSTTPTYREVAQINYNATVNSSGYIATQVTTTNAYDGNNGRAAIKGSTGLYYTVGNAGNGDGLASTTAATGVQIVVPGSTPVANPASTTNSGGTTKVGGFNITQLGYPADKTAKDDNYRGETIFNNTLFVTKGSGGNGINTVYQVGDTGSLPTLANAASAKITILPGFPTTLAKDTATAGNPFGIWFANATTLYVADEGNGVLADAGLATSKAGLQKWSLGSSGVWTLDYTLKNGLNLGGNYSVSDPNNITNSYTTATDGLRNLTGRVNNDGTVSLFAITSTVSTSGDQGADPNRLVGITDTLSYLTAAQAASEQFSVLETAAYGQVLRGVSFAPTAAATAVPEPFSIVGTLIGSAAAFRMRKRLKVENKNIG